VQMLSARGSRDVIIQRSSTELFGERRGVRR